MNEVESKQKNGLLLFTSFVESLINLSHSIFDDIGDYIPSTSSKMSRDKEKERYREKERERDRERERERERERDREEEKRRHSYFEKPRADDEVSREVGAYRHEAFTTYKFIDSMPKRLNSFSPLFLFFRLWILRKVKSCSFFPPFLSVWVSDRLSPSR